MFSQVILTILAIGALSINAAYIPVARAEARLPPWTRTEFLRPSIHRKREETRGLPSWTQKFTALPVTKREETEALVVRSLRDVSDEAVIRAMLARDLQRRTEW